MREDVPLAVIKVEKGTEKFLEVYPDKRVEKIYQKDKKIRLILKLDKKLYAPINKMEKIGKYELFLDENKIDEGYVISKENISKN